MIEKDRIFWPAAQGGGLITRRPIIHLLEIFSSGHSGCPTPSLNVVGWAGNSPDIIQRHYKGLVKQADAKEFWTIKPELISRKP